MKIKPWISKVERGDRLTYPVGTLIFYGPDNRHASKVVASVFAYKGAKPVMRKWFEDGMDVRLDGRIGKQVMRFFNTHGARQITMMAGIFGCPHEEGIDYPDGEVCPQCPFWAAHDRYEHAVPRDADWE
jgi:hypothetical protein